MPAAKSLPRALPFASALTAIALSVGCESGDVVVLGQLDPNTSPAADSGLSSTQFTPVLSSTGFFGLTDEGLPLPTCASSAQRGESRQEDSRLGRSCPALLVPQIADFSSNPSNGGKEARFRLGGSIQAGTYFYPDAPDALRSDVSDGTWHLSGTVDGVTGFGLYLQDCQLFDAAQYRGISFSIWGEQPPVENIVFYVGSAENQVSNVWLDANKPRPTDPDATPNLGRCTPPIAQFDGWCREARVEIPINRTKTRVSVLWENLAGGCPEVSADPREITAIAWYFPRSGLGAYDVDIHVDDLEFVVNPLN